MLESRKFLNWGRRGENSRENNRRSMSAKTRQSRLEEHFKKGKQRCWQLMPVSPSAAHGLLPLQWASFTHYQFKTASLYDGHMSNCRTLCASVRNWTNTCSCHNRGNHCNNTHSNYTSIILIISQSVDTKASEQGISVNLVLHFIFCYCYNFYG